MRALAVAVIGVVLIVTGCSRQQVAPGPEPVAETTRYVCGDQQFLVTTEGDRITIEGAGEPVVLQAEPAASGARYRSADEPAWMFWSRGDRAIIEQAGRRLPECRVVEDLPSSLRASGNEPFWNLTLDGGELVFRILGEEETYRSGDVERDGERVRAAGTQGSVDARFERRVCEDNMTGMPHPYRVSVNFRGQEYLGCGGDPRSLLQGQWRVTAVDASAVPDDISADIRFDDGDRVSGRAACNSFRGSFELTGETLRFGPLATTMMACEPEVMRLESRLMNVLETVHRFAIGEDGELLLHGADGLTVEAVR